MKKKQLVLQYSSHRLLVALILYYKSLFGKEKVAAFGLGDTLAGFWPRITRIFTNFYIIFKLIRVIRVIRGQELEISLRITRIDLNGSAMNYTFVPMTQAYAAEIVENWKYEAEYAIYDYANEADHMLDSEGWGRGIFAVLSQEGELIGELSIEFFDEAGEYTEYLDFDDQALINQRELWVGFGLRPDLIGQGRGAGFVEACVAYALEQTQYRGEYVRLGVTMFNQRAIRAYEKAGFQIFERSVGTINDQSFECVSMWKKL